MPATFPVNQVSAVFPAIVAGRMPAAWRLITPQPALSRGGRQGHTVLQADEKVRGEDSEENDRPVTQPKAGEQADSKSGERPDSGGICLIQSELQ